MSNPYHWVEKSHVFDTKHYRLYYYTQLIGGYAARTNENGESEFRIDSQEWKALKGGEKEARIIVLTEHLNQVEAQLQDAVSFIVEQKSKNLI